MTSYLLIVKKLLNKHSFNPVLLGNIYQACMGKMTFPFLGFLGQDVIFESSLSFYFSRAGKAEPFFGG
jgi:hypothetical protein